MSSKATKIELDIDQVLGVAEQAEVKMAAHFRHAAKLNIDLRTIAVLEALAKMEDGHREAFRTMREKRRRSRARSKKASTDKAAKGEAGDSPLSGVLKAALEAGLAIEGTEEATAELTGNETLEEILDVATVLERATVRLYAGLREYLPNPADRAILGDIIAEESEHQASLSELKERMA